MIKTFDLTTGLERAEPIKLTEKDILKLYPTAKITIRENLVTIESDNIDEKEISDAMLSKVMSE